MQNILNRRSIIENIATNAIKSSEKYFIKNHIEIYNEIIEFTSSIVNITFKEKIWFWVNNITERPKCKCGKYTKFNGSWKKGDYLRNCSVKCSSVDAVRIKNMKDNAIIKYGVDSHTKTDEYKEKKKHILMEKYGVDHYSKTNEYRDKVRNTNKEKYGVDHYSKTKEFKERTKESCRKKYGVDNAFKSIEIKNKIKNILLDKYNVDNYTKTNEYLLKKSITNLAKYGVEDYMQSDDFKIKSKNTNIIKYGAEYYSKTNDYKEKIKNTCLNKYGVEHYSKTLENKERIANTCIDRYGVDSIMKDGSFRKKFNICKDKSYVKYINDSISLFKCDCGEDHFFELNIDNYHARIKCNLPLCTICYPICDQKSIKEKELLKFIKSIYKGEVISPYRDELEIDIYLPEFKLGFEFNGLYWHSELYKDRNYHLYKTNYFKNKDIRIIHIWEDDWDFKQNIIKSQIKNWLGLIENKIYARKCEIRKVNTKESIQFLNDNHIQGTVSSLIKIGLYYQNKLVSLATFDTSEGRKKMELGGYNLNRFCNILNINVVGGLSKLLNYFKNNYNVKRLISYSDKSWSIGGVYHTLGFNVVSDGKPDYKYIIGDHRVHKGRYRKSKLNTDLTESQEMSTRNINKIYDCGKLKYEKIYNKNLGI